MKRLAWENMLCLFLTAVLSAALLAGCETENAPSNSGVGLSELFSTAPWFPKEQLVFEGLTEPEPEPQPPLAEDIILDMLADHEERLCMLEITTNTV